MYCNNGALVLYWNCIAFKRQVLFMGGNIALKQFFTRMPSCMNCHVFFSGKHHVRFVTSNLLFIMNYQRWVLCKSLLTNSTCIRFLPRMDSVMYFKLIVGWKSSWAFVALAVLDFFRCRMYLHMFINSSFVNKLFLTLDTVILFVSVSMNITVIIQVCLCQEMLIAFVTFE